MLAGPKTYELRTVADFMGVPIGSLSNCLQNFELKLRLAHALKAGLGDLGCVDEHVFKWIDDGKHDANLKITFEAPPAADAVARSGGTGQD